MSNNDSDSDSDICIGIDLGTTYCCVGIWDNEMKSVRIFEDENGHRTTPSYIAFKNGEKLIGKIAKKHNNPIYNVKRLMGKHLSEINTDEFNYSIVNDQLDYPLIKVKLDNNSEQYTKFKPEELSAMLLTKMKNIAEQKLNKKITNAVITVPAYFNDAQKNATKNAAIIAGLNCLRIINEPTAACLCYGLHEKGNINVLIFDLGGGTFDVSIININNGTFEVKAVNGDTHLGGEDFDNKILELLMCEYRKQFPDAKELTNAQIKNLKNLSEIAKCELSEAFSTEINLDISGNEFSFTLFRSVFEEICKEMFDKCFEPLKLVLEDSGFDKTEINEIVLVGGSTRIPKIQEKLSAYFDGKTLNKKVNPDEAVAYGAAIQGAILTNSDTTGKTTEIVLVDVIPLTLGIRVAGGIMSPIIKRNSSIPTEQIYTYTTIEDNQTTVDIEIYEGERKFVKDNHFLNKFSLSGLPKAIKGVPKIEVTFFMDANGILNVTACDKDSMKKETIVISKANSSLSAEEIEKMIIDADKYKLKDEIKKDTVEFKNHFIQYLQNQQSIINGSSDILSTEDLSNANQLIINSMEWLSSNDEALLQQIKECKLSVEFYLKPVLHQIYAISSIHEQNSKLTNKETQELINTI